MQIQIEVLPWLSELMNGSISRKVVMQETLPDGVSLRFLMASLQERERRFGRMVFDPERQQLTGHAEIVVNGTRCEQLGGLDVALHEGDIVTFLPGLSGG